MAGISNAALAEKLTDIADAIRGVTDVVSTMQLTGMKENVENMSTILDTRCLINGATGSNILVDVPAALRQGCVLKADYDSGEVTFPATVRADGKVEFAVEVPISKSFKTGGVKLYDAQGNRIPLHRAAAFDTAYRGVVDTSERDIAKDYSTAMGDYMNAYALDVGIATGIEVPSRVTEVDPSVLANYKATREGSIPSGVSLAGLSCQFDTTKPKVMIGFTGDVGGAVTRATMDGVEVQPIVSGSRYYFDSIGDCVWDFDKPHTLVLEHDGGSFTMGASCFTWARSAVNGSALTAKNVGKAMYNYWVLAQQFKPE